jgi:hypothetical protein
VLATNTGNFMMLYTMTMVFITLILSLHVGCCVLVSCPGTGPGSLKPCLLVRTQARVFLPWLAWSASSSRPSQTAGSCRGTHTTVS